MENTSLNKMSHFLRKFSTSVKLDGPVFVSTSMSSLRNTVRVYQFLPFTFYPCYEGNFEMLSVFLICRPVRILQTDMTLVIFGIEYYTSRQYSQ